MNWKGKKKLAIKGNLGFTLVEVVVVVVILVILAGIIIPSFANYFGRAYNEKITNEAESVLESAQVAFNELYAQNAHGEEDKCIIDGQNCTSAIYNTISKKKFSDYVKDKVARDNYFLSGDIECDIHWNSIAEDILSSAGLDMNNDDPCTVIVATGRYSSYADPANPDYDLEKAYHVYFVLYQKTFNRKAFIVMDNGEYKYSWPNVDLNGNSVTNSNSIKNNNNMRIIVDGEEKPVEIQFYYIKTGKDNNNKMNEIWNHVKDKLSKNGW